MKHKDVVEHLKGLNDSKDKEESLFSGSIFFIKIVQVVQIFADLQKDGDTEVTFRSFTVR